MLDAAFRNSLLAQLARPAAPEGPAPGDRHPVHVVYGGAHLFKADTVPKLGTLALKALSEHAPDPEALARALALPGHAPKEVPSLEQHQLASELYARIEAKLRVQAVEDFRIDFEDGFGYRPDEEEDHHALRVADQTAEAHRAGHLPPFFGIRIKPLTPELAPRAIRTLELYLRRLTEALGSDGPRPFLVTLPKVDRAETIAVLALLLERLEGDLGLAAGCLRLEFMVETPQAILDATGRCPLPGFVAAARGRCEAAHFGTYDYTAACEITAQHQAMRHPACDFARHHMQVALAGTGVRLSDGATNVLPIAPHKAGPAGTLTEAQREQNRLSVHQAWRLHFDDTLHSLRHSFYQGWDLHPAQLVSRYAALYAFFSQGREAATERLANFLAKAAQATRVGGVFDDAASGQGLLNFFLRGLACGALSEPEVLSAGLTLDELRTRSFVAILQQRAVR